MQKKTFLTAMLAAGFALSVQAEQFIEPIIVTATRTAQTVDDSLASVTIISREEIEQLQPSQLSELLRNRAGISLNQSGPFGKDTSLFMRGTNSGHVLLLIDGVRMDSATLGKPSWQFIPLSEIDRVEIVRGPRASIYGADAIGGVIQIFTRKGSSSEPKLHAHSRIGSFNTREVGAGIQAANQQTSWSLSANRQKTDGINILENEGDAAPDGFHNTALSANVTHKLGNSSELFASLLHSEGSTEADVTQGGADYTDYLQQGMHAGVRGEVSDKWFSELSLSYAADENSNFYNPDFFGDTRTDFDTARTTLNWRNDISINMDHWISLGVDWQEDRIQSSEDFVQTSRNNLGVYQIIHGTIGQHNLQGSLRFDNNQAYGGHTTGQIAWGYIFNPTLRSRLSYGTAFKAPTFNDLYWPWLGNPDLEPEKSESFEAGLRYAQSGIHWEASVYQTDIRDLIAWACTLNCDDGDWMTDVWLPQNINQVRIQGLELEAGLHAGKWQMAGSLSLVDAKDRENGKALQNRPAKFLRIDFDRQFSELSIGTSVIAQGPSYNDPSNTVQLAGYTLLNLRASWKLAPQWTLRASIENAMDIDYVTIRSTTGENYRQAGRAGYLSIHFQQ